ncbi:MAG: hypothetical protein GYA34_07675, partial [Chloroflexi bacterium]|nr:hypothetical protein [Chloroflexota bacterium]
MTDILLFNVNIVTPTELIAHGAVGISQGMINYVGSIENAPDNYAKKINLFGKYLAPGLIDMHVHGGNGISFEQPSNLEQDLQTYSNWVVSTGVTHYLCSIAAPDAQALVESIKRYVNIFEKGIKGAQPIGLHLEGPFLNKEK